MARIIMHYAAAACVAAIGLRDSPIAADTITYLDGSLWTATSTAGDTIGATVPGDLVSDLANAGRTAPTWLDLTWREQAGLWDIQAWTFSTQFLSPPSVLNNSEMILVLDGIKMASDVQLNGIPVGSTVNAFQRYTVRITGVLKPIGEVNTLTVTFPPTVSDVRNDNGRYMGCSGGWDWAPYSNETVGLTPKGIRTFSKGIWKSIYIASTSDATAAVISNLKALVHYAGPYPGTPLTDGTAAGWRVDVVTYLSAATPTSGTLTVFGSWAPNQPVSVPVTVPQGPDSPFNVSLTVPAGAVQLWWPNGLLPQRPLYTISVRYTPSSAAGETLSMNRTIGFRTVALVTADDSNPAALAGVPGSGNLTMRLKVNGADVFMRGANWIPMQETEGMGTAESHHAAIRSAADAGMNILRVWGGGTWPYDAMLDACDTLGIMLYIDAMYASQADSHHFSSQGSPVEEAELRYQMRRIGSHTSIALWDACNECGGSGPFAAFVAPIMASEDPSRPLWPASPSSGWSDGVDRLWGFPLPGRTLAIVEKVVSIGPIPGANCTAQAGGRYFGFPLSPFLAPIKVPDMATCCNMCNSKEGCAIAAYTSSGGCQLLAPPFAPVYEADYTALFVPGYAGEITALPLPNTAEQHGPYTGGGGWPTVNGGGPPANGYDPEIPPALMPIKPSGATAPGTFTSEFGVGQPASFENVSPTLDPTFWSMHGGQHPSDNCTAGFAHVCTGGNVMAQRNYGCDDAWKTYFPVGSNLNLTLDDVGTFAFAGQLYLCQLVTGLKLKNVVEWHRSENLYGLMTWQLGEVWPTYGWGSLEYSSGRGSVTGGRWKPSHYLLKRAYGDVFGACGKDGRCFVKNDGPLAGFTGVLSISLLKIADGSSVPLSSAPLTLLPGANAFAWQCADGARSPVTGCNAWTKILPAHGCDANGTDCILVSTVTDYSGMTQFSNTQLLAVPGHLVLPTPVPQVSFSVGAASPVDGSIPVTLSTTGGALFVTLFTQADGRFSDNVIPFLPNGSDIVVTFLPFSAGQVDVLTTTLRVDHLQKYF